MNGVGSGKPAFIRAAAQELIDPSGDLCTERALVYWHGRSVRRQKAQACQTPFKLGRIELVGYRDNRFDQLAAFELFLTERPVVKHLDNITWSRPASLGEFPLRPHPGYLSSPLVEADGNQLGQRRNSGVQNEQQIDVRKLGEEGEVQRRFGFLEKLLTQLGERVAGFA